MLGGDRGLSQVRDPDARDRQIERILSARAGTDGASVANVRHLLRDIRVYAAEKLGCATSEAADAACFPMSSALAHEIIAHAHARASSAAAGSQKGSTVGARTRDVLIFAAERLLWPIDVPRVALEAAAPKAVTAKREKAGAIPLAGKCQLEYFADGNGLEGLTPSARTACRFYARSFLAAGVDQSVRIAEGARVELWADEEDPLHVMRGHAFLGKDGSPLDLYAPAEGFLGAYDWWPEHLVACAGAIAFPAWEKPWGSKGAISKAGALKLFAVASKADIRAAFKHLLSLPPLSYTEDELKEMNLQGHSAHASPPEWARCIGENPSLPPPASFAGADLAAALAAGFTDRDIDALGHWMRDAGAKNEASVSEAVLTATTAVARKAAAVAALPGKAASRGKMRNYYGQAGASSTRFSERFTQLRVRQRLIHTVRALIGGRVWHSLPRGPRDMQLLRGSLPA